MSIKQEVSRLRNKGFFDILIGGTSSKMIAFLSSIVIVRLVSKSDYAVLGYADNIYSYIVLFSGAGMSSAVLKYSVQNDESKNAAFYRFAFKWGTLFQIIVLTVLLIITKYIKFPFDGTEKIMYSLLPYGFLYYWVHLFQSFLRSRFENRKYAISSFVQVLLTFVLSVITALTIGVIGVPISRGIAMIISIAVFLPTLISYYSDHKHCSVLSGQDIKSFIALAISMLVSNVFSMIMPNNEMFLINNILKNEIITANYKVASLIPSQLPFVTSTLVIYFFPLVAQKSANVETWSYLKRIGFGTFIINLLITIVGCVLTPFIISIAYGDEYSDIMFLSIIIWWSFFFNAGFRMLPMNILPALGYVRFNVVVAALSALILFALDYIMLKTVGLYGVVIIRMIVNFASGTLYWGYLYKKCIENK
ncbi:Membrane protein involved in the export of O-antigen and teichoic acid [Butyrivibrio sp. Su6]|uniref:oligosaccharide flippase family protein n=1 Tax=Butyrivibrio sp. Su6 TaxID=1520810 RepID=UPI00089E64AA|nr:oligosaccharide flippase family protein [Butyrivibrio sp. Su6]SEG16807.1 Membrane protein involved in the export of O-antigen and teichoic acid [Butyrivibrio sp. Su6]